MRQLVEANHPELGANGLVNHYGISQDFLNVHRNGSGAAPPSQAQSLKFLYVMNYTLQKNLRFILQALAQAKAEGLPVQVVITSWLDTGPRTCFAQDMAFIEEHDLISAGYLVPVGPKYGTDLVQLYREVDACVFPSFCESFGHPLVEALAMGKALVCADREYAR